MSLHKLRIEMLDKSIEADPNNAQAYAWKACSIGQGIGGGYLEGDEETNFEKIWAGARHNFKHALQIQYNFKFPIWSPPGITQSSLRGHMRTVKRDRVTSVAAAWRRKRSMKQTQRQSDVTVGSG